MFEDIPAGFAELLKLFQNPADIDEQLDLVSDGIDETKCRSSYAISQIENALHLCHEAGIELLRVVDELQSIQDAGVNYIRRTDVARRLSRLLDEWQLENWHIGSKLMIRQLMLALSNFYSYKKYR